MCWHHPCKESQGVFVWLCFIWWILHLHIIELTSYSYIKCIKSVYFPELKEEFCSRIQERLEELNTIRMEINNSQLCVGIVLARNRRQQKVVVVSKHLYRDLSYWKLFITLEILFRMMRYVILIEINSKSKKAKYWLKLFIWYSQKYQQLLKRSVFSENLILIGCKHL